VSPRAADPRAAALRRARLLVSVAALAAVATAVFLALLVAALLRDRGAGTAAAYGLVAFGAAGLATGLLVLARAGAVARRVPWRARGLCARCVVGALVGVVAVLAAGGIAILRTGAPVWGAAVGAVLLVPLVALGTWQRAAVPATVRGTGPPADRPRRSGGGGESESGRTTGAR
jgi:hypothetical protein